MSDLILINPNTLYNKSERITAALFLVSNTMAGDEILKTKIRSLGLDLVSLCISLKDNTEANSHSLLKTLERKVLELVSLLNITSISGFISEMNACILKKEFEYFLKSISDLIHFVETSKLAISKEFFENGNNNDKAPLKDNYSQRIFLKDKPQDKIGRKNQRNKDIFNLISRKGDVNIKDIASFIKGCSEKTVQRELNMLIKSGLIKKEGERRWSRYSLV